MTAQWDGASPARDIAPPDGTFQIILNGEIDMSRQEELASLADAYRTSQERGVEVDLSGVTFIDSTGVAFLFRLRATATERAGTVRLLGPSRMCRRVLEITSIDRLVEVVPPG
jgi:anti-sigma B factor antagonist